MQNALGIDAAIDAKDLALLDSVFSDWCYANGVAKTSVEAQAAARQIIELWEYGWKNPSELRAMIEPIDPGHALTDRAAR